MAIKKRKVIINGNEWGDYDISFKKYIKLQCIRLYLWFLRWMRRLFRGAGYCKYVFAILPFWAIFLIIIKVWGSYRLESYTWDSLLWDAKGSIFSSVVLAAATSFITQHTKKKTAYIEQHELYIQTMDKMSVLFKQLNALVFNDLSKEFVPFWPFYIDNMGNSFCDRLYDMTTFENKENEKVYEAAYSVSSLKN